MSIRRTLLPMLTALALGAAPAGAAPPPPQPAVSAPSLVGTWQGELKVAFFTLHLITTFSEAPAGGLKGVLRVPEQGNVELPIDQVSFKDNTLSFHIEKIKADYNGSLSADGKQFQGTWSQNGHSLPLNFARTSAPLVLHRPQEPQAPYPYVAEEVHYPNAQAGITLAGTLTHPQGQGPFPVVLLITGSGQQNRDEEIFGHKPFKLLADSLTRRGVAVLRVDDRGIGGSGGEFAKATTQDFARDVLAGIAYLKSRKDIDAHRIGLLGHSEGGIIAPMVAAQSQDVAFIVLMAGTGVPGSEVIERQSAEILRRSGAPEAEVARNRRVQQAIAQAIREEQDPASLKSRVRAILEPLTHAGPDGPATLTPDQLTQQVEASASPWFRFFSTYDPRPALARVKCPVLVMNGGSDLQVLPDQNVPAITHALAQGGNRDVTVAILPGLNHLFQTSASGLPGDYGKLEETIAPAALSLIDGWVLAHTTKK